MCASGEATDLELTDAIACGVLEDLKKEAPAEIRQQMDDNIRWIKGAQANRLVVGIPGEDPVR